MRQAHSEDSNLAPFNHLIPFFGFVSVNIRTGLEEESDPVGPLEGRSMGRTLLLQLADDLYM